MDNLMMEDQPQPFLQDFTVGKRTKQVNKAENKWKKICEICGDFSLGHNFGVITCESCKAFFRRNALRLKEFTCPFEDNCNIDCITRRFCQKCRLKKCLAIGMKKEWIMSENDKSMKKKKRIDANRQQRYVDTNLPSLIGSKNRRKPQAMVKPSSRDAKQCSLEDGMMMKSRVDMNQDSSLPSLDPQQSQQFYMKMNQTLEECEIESLHLIADTLQPPSQEDKMEAESEDTNINNEDSDNQDVVIPSEKESLLSVDQVISVAIKAEYEADSLQKGCQPALTKLNDREQAKLHELYIASRSLAEPVGLEDDLSFNRYSSEPSLISVINLTDLAIKRIIKMAKQIFSFTQLCQEDQVALLKGGCIELMILRSVLNFDPEKNGWQIPGSSSLRVLSMDVLKEASQLGVNLYEEHLKFVSSFSPVWRNDENLMLLMSAIALFSPDRANIIHAKVIKCEQDGYFYLLRRYLETLYAGCEAREVYLQLIGKLLELHRLNESHIKLFMEVNPKQIEPLLIEIFDLNAHKIQK